jgi:arginine/ornithine permease
MEFWFSSIKVTAIILFIVIGGCAVFGLIDFKGGQETPFLSHFMTDKGLFPNGVLAVMFTLVMVNFSFQGTELVGIAAGESESPEKTLPKSIRNVIWRTLFFFVLAMFVLVAILPYETAGVIESPFVAVLDQIGIPFAADMMNFVILTAILSVANSGLYAASRMMWSLSTNKMGPAFLTRLTKKGVPINALLITIGISGCSLLTSVHLRLAIFLSQAVPR